MWARGQPLYEAAVDRARAAVADGGGAIGAVLWFQGESDTIELDDARSYGAKMERLVADLRADLHLPNLLVIQVNLFSLLVFFFFFLSISHHHLVIGWFIGACLNFGLIELQANSFIIIIIMANLTTRWSVLGK